MSEQECDMILDKLANNEISNWEARKKLSSFFDNSNIYKCSDSSKYKGTIIALYGKRRLEVHWCLGKLIRIEEDKEKQICYKTNEPCKYDCQGLCKDSF